MGRRWLAAVLAGVLMLGACGCATIPKNAASGSPAPTASDDTPAPTVTLHPFTLAYNSRDSLDPYTSSGRVNHALTTLLYEGLTALDASMQPQPQLASSVKTEGTRLTATLRADAVFSDGSAVKAEDVTASFGRAKADETYQELLKNVASVKAEGNTLVFTLSAPDPYAAACLSFPVVRTQGKTTLGSGRYVFGSTPSTRLTANPHAKNADQLPEILLSDITDEDAMLHGLENGTLSYYFSELSDGSALRTGNATANVAMNELVFLGVNSKKTALADERVRQALAQAVDRADLASMAFSGCARAATAPFHPLFLGEKAANVFPETENTDKAVALLREAGYNSDKGKAKTLNLTLLVNEENAFRAAAAEHVQAQLKAAGVTVTVKSAAFSEYQSLLKKGDFDLYLGDVRLSANMSLTPFFSGDASYGVHKGAAADAYTAFVGGEGTLDAFLAAFAADAPYIPLCWRDGAAAYDRAIPHVMPAPYDIYADIENWGVTTAEAAS